MSLNTEKNWNWLGRKFNQTRWTLVHRIKRSPGSDSPSAEEFCRCYWYPLYGFLRQKGFSAPDAQDHVQSFLSHFLSRGLLGKADPERGMLRTYLITLLVRHTTKRRKFEAAQKRGGMCEHVPLLEDGAEASYQENCEGGGTPEDVFRKTLATRLVAEAIQSLEQWYGRKNKSALLEEILPALEGPLKDSTYAEAGVRLGMRTGAVTMAARHLRMRFKDAVTAAAARILGIPPGMELDRELGALFAGGRTQLSV
jgi:RNA polymerase sigma-70 factor (ECF subfamily)